MDEASRNNFIRKALMHANRLTNLMNDVSAITRLDEGGALINTEELDYHDLVYTDERPCRIRHSRRYGVCL